MTTSQSLNTTSTEYTLPGLTAIPVPGSPDGNRWYAIRCWFRILNTTGGNVWTSFKVHVGQNGDTSDHICFTGAQLNDLSQEMLSFAVRYQPASGDLVTITATTASSPGTDQLKVVSDGSQAMNLEIQQVTEY